MQRAPSEILGVESLVSFLADLAYGCVPLAGGIRFDVAPVTPPGEDSGKLVPGFLQTLPHSPLPFVDFALYPFAEINLSHEYTQTLNTVIPSSKSSYLGWSWRPLAHPPTGPKKAQVQMTF